MNGLAQLKKGVSMARSKRSITLPNGDIFEWYQTPLTLSQRERATKLAGKSSEDTITVALIVLIMKATNQEGQKLFQQGELAELKTELPESVMGDLVVEVFRDTLSEQDEEGNVTEVETAPKSSSPSSRKTAS